MAIFVRFTKTLILWMMLISGIALATYQAKASQSGVTGLANLLTSVF